MTDKLPKKCKGSFKVRNDKGLHTRPSTELVKCAASFRSKIELSCKNYVVNAKSLLGILMLAANKGALIRVEAFGTDSNEAVEALLRLANNNFNVNY